MRPSAPKVSCGLAIALETPSVREVTSAEQTAEDLRLRTDHYGAAVRAADFVRHGTGHGQSLSELLAADASGCSDQSRQEESRLQKSDWSLEELDSDVTEESWIEGRSHAVSN